MKLRKKTNIEIAEENNLNFSVLTNVVEEANTKAKIRTTLQIISKILCGTLGPYGTTTIIQDREMRHFATKDGYDLVNRITFSDEVSRTVLELVRQVASNQVLTVGDGSTSAIVVSNALYSALTNPNMDLFNRVAPKDVLDMLKDLGDYIEKELYLLAKPLSKDLRELETVAMISTNNDRETGKLIKEIYDKIGEFGFITTDVLSKKEKDSYEVKQGLEWSRGYIEDYFAYQKENKKVIHDQEPRVFLSNSTLTYADLEVLLSQVIGDVCGKQSAELVIVANGFDEDVKTFFKANRTQHLASRNKVELSFTVVDIDQVTQGSVNTLDDLATLTGCEVYDKFKHKPTDYLAKPERFIGRAEKIIITQKSTQIIGKELSPELNKIKDMKVSDLKEKLTKLLEVEEPNKEEDFEIYEIKRRVSSLTDSTAVIHVSGKSLAERMTRERLFEDAILASRSAIRHGVIPGGNISIPRILEFKNNELMKKLSEKYSYLPVANIEKFCLDFIKIVKEAFIESYRNVLDNSYFNDEEVENVLKTCMMENKFYNLKLHKYEAIGETQVINSVDTDVQILKSVISIIGIIATSNQMITLNLSITDQIKK